MEYLYKIYFDLAQVIFLVLDGDGNILDLNKRACEILGVSKEEAIGLNWCDNFVPDNAKEIVRDVILRVKNGDKSAEEFENEILTRYGKRLVKWRNACVKDENGKVKILSSGMDLTDERKRLMELERYVRFYRFLMDLTAITLRKGWSEDTLKEILKLAVKGFSKAQTGSVVLRKGDYYRFVALEGFDFEKLKDVKFDPKKVGVFARKSNIVNWKKRLLAKEVDEKSRDILRKYGRVEEIKATLIFPITYKEEIIGYITLDNFDSEDAFDHVDLDFASIFQAHVEILLEKHELERELLYRAEHDPLTGALNRRAFLERLTKALERSKRNNLSFGIVYFDLDNFKEINDEYGHECGDYVLGKIVDKLSKCMRLSDDIGRIGGDEFAILLYDADLNGLVAFVERFKEFLENLTVEWKGIEIKIDASAGFAVYPDDGKTVEELLRIADHRMYVQKRGKIL